MKLERIFLIASSTPIRSFVEPFAEFAGAGAAVPISGFGFLMSQGVKEGLAADGALGILTGGLKSAAAGISAAIFFGLIAGLITKSGDK